MARMVKAGFCITTAHNEIVVWYEKKKKIACSALIVSCLLPSNGVNMLQLHTACNRCGPKQLAIRQPAANRELNIFWIIDAFFGMSGWVLAQLRSQAK